MMFLFLILMATIFVLTVGALRLFAVNLMLAVPALKPASGRQLPNSQAQVAQECCVNFGKRSLGFILKVFSPLLIPRNGQIMDVRLNRTSSVFLTDYSANSLALGSFGFWNSKIEAPRIFTSLVADSSSGATFHACGIGRLMVMADSCTNKRSNSIITSLHCGTHQNTRQNVIKKLFPKIISQLGDSGDGEIVRRLCRLPLA